jgi:hypothetical protein
MTVEQVHNDFMTAEDRILKDAKRILNSPQTNLASKGDRVAKLGFTNSRPATISKNIADNLTASKERVELIAHYQHHYPLNKFITEDEVNRLCEKYDLFLADASRYKGDIPERNISEIERFKLRKEDYMDGLQDLGSVLWASMLDFRLDFNETTGEITRKLRKKTESEDTKVQRPFKIVAPLKDLNLSNSETKGRKIENYTPDPVVLQPVKGGYLIVTAWGDEASDEIVINPVQN